MSPKFSIITIVFNGEALLKGTAESVLNQTFTDYEYIIIDGKSKDSTVEIIKEYAQQYPLSLSWISEPDKGLYDAMNKGLKMAKGEYLLFLNCGDQFFEPTTLEKLAAKSSPDVDILYGETMLVDENRMHLGTRTKLTVQKLPPQLTWQNLRFGMVVCHQSFLPKRTIAPLYIEDNLAADIDWVIKCLKKSQKTVFTDTIISEYLVGGVSKKQHQRSLKDRYWVLKTHSGWLPNLLAHGWVILRAIWSKWMGNVKY